MRIRTVCGDIDAREAGCVQCHEHIFLQKGASYDVNPSLWMDDADASLREMQAYRAAGGGLIVDAQPVFAGRMPEALIRLSEESRVHIVAVTGFHRKIFYSDDAPLMQANAEQLCSVYTDDVMLGMLTEDGKNRVDGRCGVLKGALEANGVRESRWSEVRFIALVEAAKRTDVPLMFHVEKGADLPGFLRFLTDEGIDLDRVILCHLDRTHYDPSLHKELLQAGVRLNYDSVCRLKYLSHEKELSLIADMCKAGYAQQITLSLDTTRARLRSYGGTPGLDFILTDFIGMMRRYGISDEAIACMTKKNGQAALACKGL